MKLRFTGENPSLEYLIDFPNWSNAYDEEEEDDQDETTLKPHDQQNYIDDYVSFTAADITASDGRKFVALLDVIATVPGGIDVYDNDSWIFLRNKNFPIERWELMQENWLSEDTKITEILFEDAKWFSLEVKSRLPMENGKYIHFQIETDGFSKILN